MRLDRPESRERKGRNLLVHKAVHYHVPAFMIVGVQKAGTTFLHGLLAQHPSLESYGHGSPNTPYRETQTFRKARKFTNEEWPMSLEMHGFCREVRSRDWCGTGGNRSALHFTAYPRFLAIPALGERLLAALPNIRTIVILRDPLDRYVSHLQMALANGNLKEFKPPNCTKDYRCGKSGMSFFSLLAHLSDMPENHTNYGHAVGRGMYVRQLKLWFKLFPYKTRTHVILNDDLNENPEGVAADVLKFLGLGKDVVPPFKFAPNQVYARVHEDLDNSSRNKLHDWFPPPVRNALSDFYKIENRDLSELLGGMKIPWQ